MITRQIDPHINLFYEKSTDKVCFPQCWLSIFLLAKPIPTCAFVILPETVRILSGIILMILGILKKVF